MTEEKKLKKNNAEAEVEGNELCAKCGNQLEWEEGEKICPNCDAEIDFFGEDEEE